MNSSKTQRFSLLLCALCVARAFAAPNPTSLANSPEGVVRDFIRAYERGDYPQMARNVVGANPKNFLPLPKYLAPQEPYPVQKLNRVWQSTVRLQLRIQTDGGNSSGSRNVYSPSVELVPTRQINSVWKIVPPEWEPSFGYLREGRGEISIQAAMLAHPLHQGVAWQKQKMCRRQMEDLGSALFSATVEAPDSKINVPSQKWKPFLLGSLGDNDKRQIHCWATGADYGFNAKVNRLNLEASTPRANRIVVFYEGRNEKLDFAHPEGSAVHFLDGHTEIVGPKQIHTLIWNPK